MYVPRKTASQFIEIINLDLPLRAENILLREGIHRINDLTAMTEEKIAALPGIGKRSLANIKESLRVKGLELFDPVCKWRPIETAPKDGAWVLLYSCFSTKKPDCGVARWDERYWLLAAEYGVKAIFENPTHWMPLPDRPDAGQ